MKTSLIAILGFTLVGCTTCDPAIQPKEEQEQRSRQPEASLQTFTDTLKKLDVNAPGTIDHALRLYSLLVPADSARADSAAVALMDYIHRVAGNENQQLLNDTTDLKPLLNPARPLTEKQSALRAALRENHLKPVSDGEGGVYFVPAYEMILPAIQAATSAAVDSYLNLAAQEDTSSTFKDAGLAIDITALVDRLIASEHLRNQKLPESFAEEVTRLNRFYTHALISGVDNSPSLERNTTSLTSQFEKGYQYLLTKYPSSKAAAKIREWMAVVQTGDRQKTDAYLRQLNR